MWNRPPACISSTYKMQWLCVTLHPESNKRVPLTPNLLLSKTWMIATTFPFLTYKGINQAITLEAELEIRIHKCSDIMSVHYQFCTDIFKFCSDIFRFCSHCHCMYSWTVSCATRLVQFAADWTDSTPYHQTWPWFDTQQYLCKLSSTMSS